MNILVTGGKGQLGTAIRHAAGKSNDNYIFTGHDELDITSREAVTAFITGHNIDVVINCAAFTNVEKAEECASQAELLNAVAAGYLAESVKSRNAVLIHISTDYVFGKESRNTPYNEDAETAPTGIYGLSKLHGEKAVTNSGCRYLIIRTSWLYSENGHNFLNTILSLSADRDEIKVVSDQTGSPTYAADLAEVICRIIETRQFTEGIYHYSNEGACSWYDFATAILNLAGNVKCNIKACNSDEFPSKVRRPAYSVLDKSKIRQTFGITIPHWLDSLGKCMRNR